MLLARFEAHFNFGAHFDGVAVLDRGLVTELSPIHGLTELRAGFERRDFSVRADDDLALNGSSGGLPKGCGLNGGALNQECTLGLRSNIDFGDVLLVDSGVLLCFRAGFVFRGRSGSKLRNQK